MSSNWDAYLDSLEEALRALHKGATVADFPGHEGLGPLPEELRERAEALLRAARQAEGPVRARRGAAARRLGALAEVRARRGLLRA